MGAPRLERAKQLLDEIREVLDASGLEDVVTTLDARHVESGSRKGIVLVAAPRLTFDGAFGSVQAAFAVHVIAGPAEDYLAAWERLDEIVDVLVAGNINLADGEPGAFEPPRGPAIPAYTLTLNDLD